MPEKNETIETVKKVGKIGTAFGTGVILGEIATAFIPGGAWFIVKGVAYLASVVLSDMLSKQTDKFIDEEVDSFLEELQENTEEGA